MFSISFFSLVCLLSNSKLHQKALHFMLKQQNFAIEEHFWPWRTILISPPIRLRPRSKLPSYSVPDGDRKSSSKSSSPLHESFCEKTLMNSAQVLFLQVGYPSPFASSAKSLQLRNIVSSMFILNFVNFTSTCSIIRKIKIHAEIFKTHIDGFKM